ncbi:MAG: biosynthetic arginine decarboxylase [Gammaproteobacteria bacterium]|jgi:arginine decarboxylase
MARSVSYSDSDAASAPHSAWSSAHSQALYRVESWGAPYFCINDAGHVAVEVESEKGTQMSIDVAAVVEELRDRGVQFPMLLRFQDILRGQVKRLNTAFRSAITEFEYPNEYRAVYPIKVNQLHEVVDELLEAGREYGMGLECGSKAELIATLPQVDGEMLLICNGVKDYEMLSLMVACQQLGQNNVPVIENYSEFTQLKALAFETGFVPQIGVRVRLATRGSGRWSESSGVNSKFGLSVSEVVRMVDELEASGLPKKLVLLHCHIGSQIADIQVLRQAAKEVTRIYCELMERGCEIKWLDLGGGLGVNYDSTEVEDEAGINYSLQEYANAIVHTVKQVCDDHEVRCPGLVTESGRALTAHHSVLIVPVLTARKRENRRADIDVPEGAAEPLPALKQMLERLDTATASAELIESWHVANEYLDEARTLFNLGYLDLRARATADTLYWRLASRISKALEAFPDLEAPEVAELKSYLTDQYLCDFSVFQSMLDHWAIAQPFPIMPLNRLDEEPTRRGIVVDLTCDSDGRVSHYVTALDDKRYLPLHELRESETYYLGFFLMGAYEDVVGDAHNLFGRVSEAHIYADEEEPRQFWVEKIIPGTAVQDILAQMQYFPNDLHRRMSELVRSKIRDGVVRPTQGMRFLDQYMACFAKNTYCDPSELSRGKPDE